MYFGGKREHLQIQKIAEMQQVQHEGASPQCEGKNILVPSFTQAPRCLLRNPSDILLRSHRFKRLVGREASPFTVSITMEQATWSIWRRFWPASRLQRWTATGHWVHWPVTCIQLYTNGKASTCQSRSLLCIR